MRLLPPRVVLDLALGLVVRFDVALPVRELDVPELPERDLPALR